MDLEGQEGFRQMAKMGLTIWRGLIEDGADINEAFYVLAAMFAGMMQSGSMTQGEN